MKWKEFARTILILAMIGTFVSAEQVSGESVFTVKGGPPLEKLVIQPSLFAEAGQAESGPAAVSFSAFAADTIETFEVEVEEDKGPGVIKQLVIFAVLTAIAGYAVFTLLDSDDETENDKPGGKDPPVFSAAVMRIPLTRSH